MHCMFAKQYFAWTAKYLFIIGLLKAYQLFHDAVMFVTKSNSELRRVSFYLFLLILTPICFSFLVLTVLVFPLVFVR